MGARMVINSYGIPTKVRLADNDKVNFVNNGMYLQHIRMTQTGTTISRDTITYYLGYINRVTFDTVGGTLGNLFLNLNSSAAATEISMNDIVSLTIEPAIDSTADADQDEITDFNEFIKFRTDPHKKDSDGDGYDDSYEMQRFGAGEKPLEFNPLVADQPRIDFRMLASPKIEYIRNEGGQIDSNIEVGSSHDYGQSNTSSYSHSLSDEGSVSLMIGLDWGYGGKSDGWNFTQKNELTTQYTRNDTRTTGFDASLSYNDNFSKIESETRSKNWQIIGAKISFPIFLKNNGHLACTIKNLLFSIKSSAGLNNPLLLESVTSDADFPLIIAPGDSISLKLSKDITKDNADYIGKYSQSIVVSLVSADIILDNTHDYVKSLTDINALCANIQVDFGGESVSDGKGGYKTLDPFFAKVATKTKYNTYANDLFGAYGPVKFGEALRNMGVNYSTNDAGKIMTVWSGSETLESDSATWGSWNMMHVKSESDKFEVLHGTQCNPDSLTIYSGDSYLLCFSRDRDQDHVPDIIEKKYGIFDKDTNDYDDDGITDSAEIYGWFPRIIKDLNDTTKIDTLYLSTNPKLADTDHDGKGDKTDPDPLNRKKFSVSNLTKLTFIEGILGKDTTKITLNKTDSSKVITNDTLIGAQPVIRFTFDTIPIIDTVITSTGSNFTWNQISSKDSLPVIYELKFDNQIKFNGNQITVKFTPEDKSRTITRIITFNAPLILSKNQISADADINAAWKNLTISYDPKDQLTRDPRTTGVIILKSTDTTASFEFSTRRTLIETKKTIGTTTWMRIDNSGDLSSVITIADTALQTGQSYKYIAVPYFHNTVADSFYYYNTHLVKVQRTKYIIISATYRLHADYINFDGSQKNVNYRSAFNVTRWMMPENQESKVYDNVAEGNVSQGNYAGDDRTADAGKYFRASDSLWITTWLKIDKSGSGYLECWGSTRIFDVEISKLLTKYNTLNALGSGLALTSDINYTSGNKNMTNFPTATSKNQITYTGATKNFGVIRSRQVHSNFTPTLIIQWWLE
jgi:hypothetical protein